MDARICTNPSCRTVLPYDKCSLCGTATEPLAHISLTRIGVNGTAHLAHSSTDGYTIAVNTISGSHHLHVPVADLVQRAQLSLPHLDPASGLEIMDTLNKAARLLQTKNTGHWAQWVTFLLEALQERADQATFQAFLRDLQQNLQQAIVEDDEMSPMYDAAKRLKAKWNEGRGYDPPKETATAPAHGNMRGKK